MVSFPSWKLFEEQSAEYKASVLPAGVPKLAVEAGATLGWWKYVGQDGDVVGLDRFGASAPGPVVMKELGFTRGECGGKGEEAAEAGVSELAELGIRRRRKRIGCCRRWLARELTR